MNLALDYKTRYTNLTDEVLVERVAENDNWACSKLMQRYKDVLRFEIQNKIYNKTDVESLVMQSFAKAFINIRQYNSQFAFSTWLFTIAKNCCIDHLRNKRNKIETVSIDEYKGNSADTDYANILPSSLLNPEEELIRKQRALTLYKTVSKLRPIYREVIKQFYFKEKSLDEVAKFLEIPIGRVKVNLFRARKELYSSYGVI